MTSIFLILYTTHRISMVMFTELIFLLFDTSESPTQSLKWQNFWIPCAAFHILSESKQSLSGSLHFYTSTLPPFCNSFTHTTSHSYSYLVLRHPFSHQITKAGCIKTCSKHQGTVISVTAIQVSTERQTYAHIFKV